MVNDHSEKQRQKANKINLAFSPFCFTIPGDVYDGLRLRAFLNAQPLIHMDGNYPGKITAIRSAYFI
jgi:hypothetical protein